MRREDLPPSQGGKYAGFGSSVSNTTPSRSFSTQDFVGGNLGGLTQSLSNFSLSSASGLSSKVAEVGWKFTNLAGQKAAELSEAVTEKVTDVVHKKGGLDLSSLWGSTRSDYLPCEDSGLMHQSAGGYGGYHDSYQDISSSQDTGAFSGFGGGGEASSQGKSNDGWDDWNDSGWSQESPARSSKQPKSSKSSKKKSEPEAGGKLIDFDSGSSKKEKDDGWNNWDDDGW